MEKVTIYEPNKRAKTGWIKTWWILVSNTWYSRDLIWQLFKRDFLMQFKKSFLGIGWSFLSPLIGMLGWLLYNVSGILNPGNTGVPYSVYVILGTTSFGMVGGFITGASNVLESGRGFINQVNYHHDSLLFKQALITILNFIIMLVPSLCLMLVLNVYPSLGILIIPFMLIPLFLLCSAIGLPLALLGSISKDIMNLVNIFLSVLLAITPIVYSPSNIQSQIFKSVIFWNPFTYLVGGIREMILYGHISNPKMYFIYSGIATILFLIAWRVFYIVEEKVIEKM